MPGIKLMQPRGRDWQRFDREFDIKISRIIDTKDSLLAYSKKLSHSSRNRGVYFHSKESRETENPENLLIRATHIAKKPIFSEESEKSLTRSEDSHKREVSIGMSKTSKSLPTNMRLEPLLGSNKERYKLNLASASDLDEILAMSKIEKAVKRKTLEPLVESSLSRRLIRAPPPPPFFSLRDQGPMRTNSPLYYDEPIPARRTILVNIMGNEGGLINGSEEEDDDTFGDIPCSGSRSDERGMFMVMEDTPRDKLLKSGGRRKKRLQRMKIQKPGLDDIIESDGEGEMDSSRIHQRTYRRTSVGSVLSSNSSASKMPFPRSHVLDAIPELEDFTRLQVKGPLARKKDTAILRNIKNVSLDFRGSGQLRQQAMLASHARRKFGRVPPLDHRLADGTPHQQPIPLQFSRYRLLKAHV